MVIVDKQLALVTQQQDLATSGKQTITLQIITVYPIPFPFQKSFSLICKHQQVSVGQLLAASLVGMDLHQPFHYLHLCRGHNH